METLNLNSGFYAGFKYKGFPKDIGTLIFIFMYNTTT